jgi:hypothetical protein
MAKPWIAIIGILVGIAVIVAYVGVILWLRSPNKGVDINLKQVAVLVVLAVLLVVLQCNPPYVVEEERDWHVRIVPPTGEVGEKDTAIISVRKRVTWDQDTMSAGDRVGWWDRGASPEPSPEQVKSRGDHQVELKNGLTLIWHIDTARLIAESALGVAGGALLCCLLRTRGSPGASRAG